MAKIEKLKKSMDTKGWVLMVKLDGFEVLFWNVIILTISFLAVILRICFWHHFKKEFHFK